MEERQIGLVTAVSGGTATVQIHRKGSCSEGGCAHGQMLGPMSSELTLDAQNKIGATKGDWVEVAYDGSLALKAAFGIYVLPIVLGLATYGIGSSLLSNAYGVLVSVLSGAVMVGGFSFALRHFSRRRFDYAVVARAESASLSVAPSCQGCSLATKKGS